MSAAIPMRQALDTSPQILTYLDYARTFGLGYDVTSRTGAIFPAYEGQLDPAYATTR